MPWCSTSSSAPTNYFKLKKASLYLALPRLLKAKLVKAEWMVSTSTNHRVRMYEITRAGLRHLEREVFSFDRMLEGIEPVLGPGRRIANS
jgi:PadR family transcriptional regulator, regulatory protein PadR